MWTVCRNVRQETKRKIQTSRRFERMDRLGGCNRVLEAQENTPFKLVSLVSASRVCGTPPSVVPCAISARLISPPTDVWGRARRAVLPYSYTRKKSSKKPRAQCPTLLPHLATPSPASLASFRRNPKTLAQSTADPSSVPVGWRGSEVGSLLRCGTARFGAELRE